MVKSPDGLYYVRALRHKLQYICSIAIKQSATLLEGIVMASNIILHAQALSMRFRRPHHQHVY